MNYETKPIPAVFKGRPNRFLGVVDLEGEETFCFIPNPGRMKELMIPGVIVYLLKKTGKQRKTAYDLILVEHNNTLVSVDSRYPNKLVTEAVKEEKLEPFKGYTVIKKEPTHQDSRLDLLLGNQDKQIMIECKSCTLLEDGVALFPDAPTKRGARHVNALINALEEGRSAVTFIIQRGDAKTFRPNIETDPEFTNNLINAYNKGVEIYAYSCKIDLKEILIMERVPVQL